MIFHARSSDIIGSQLISRFVKSPKLVNGHSSFVKVASRANIATERHAPFRATTTCAAWPSSRLPRGQPATRLILDKMNVLFSDIYPGPGMPRARTCHLDLLSTFLRSLAAHETGPLINWTARARGGSQWFTSKLAIYC